MLTKPYMAGNRGEREKITSDFSTNLMNVINKNCETVGEDVMPNASPRRGRSPSPHRNITKPSGKGASTSAEEGTPPAVKKLLEAWLTDTLASVLNKLAPSMTAEITRACMIQQTNEQCNQPNPPTTDITPILLTVQATTPSLPF